MSDSTLSRHQRNPKIIGNIKIKETSYHKALLKDAAGSGLGVAHSESGEADKDPVLIELQKICVLNGYSFRKSRYQDNWEGKSLYPIFSYVYGAGSVVFHRDNGLGLTVNIFVSTKEISQRLVPAWDADPCVFCSQGRHINLNVGDIFVFNGDNEHAWISNCRWLIASLRVKKKRKNCVT